jgi:hypothetical protein
MCGQFYYMASDFYTLLARICQLDMRKPMQIFFIYQPVGTDSLAFPVKVTLCAQGQPLDDFRKWRISGTGLGPVATSKWTLWGATSCGKTATSVAWVAFQTVVLLRILVLLLFPCHCATSRKVAGSIPDGVTRIFHWHNPSGRTVALGLTQPLTEMSTRNNYWTRNNSWGVKVDGA